MNVKPVTFYSDVPWGLAGAGATSGIKGRPVALMWANAAALRSSTCAINSWKSARAERIHRGIVVPVGSDPIEHCCLLIPAPRDRLPALSDAQATVEDPVTAALLAEICRVSA